MRGYIAVILILVAGLLVSAQLNNSFDSLSNIDVFRSAQLVRLDESDTLTNTTIKADGQIIGDDQVVSGETPADTASGDHTKSLDCRGFVAFAADAFEYGTGSCEFKVWNCLTSSGFEIPSGLTTTTVAPADAPTSADPDPFCTDLTAAAGVTLDGVLTTHFSQTGVVTNFLVGELQTITGSCDATFMLSCARQ